MKLISIAEEFGEKISSLMGKINVRDLMLFGSLARGKNNAYDIDILIIHNNVKLEKFSELMKKGEFSSPEEAFLYLNAAIPELNLMEQFQKKRIRKIIKEGLLQTSYMKLSYFSDSKYFSFWNSLNMNPNFAINIFPEGKLYNPKTGKYDISAISKYKINSKQQNQLSP